MLNIDGEGGSGKSYLIKLLSSHLLQTAEENGRKNPVFQVAPTDIDAHGIQRYTRHRLLTLHIKGNLQDFSSANPSALQNLLKEVFFLIFDEKSMIGLRFFGVIDQGLQQNRPSHGDESMGGLNFLLMGDFAQLPTVLQKPLYLPDCLHNHLESNGQMHIWLLIRQFAFNKLCGNKRSHKQHFERH